MKQRLLDSVITGLFYAFRLCRINPKKIVISSYLGKGYGDNPKYIVEELLRRSNRYDIVWLSKNNRDCFPKGVRRVSYKSIRAIYELCTAKVWIDNRRKPPYVRKRKSQKYIMTWHGYLAIKRVEKDVESSLDPRYVAMAKNDSTMIDYFVSGSKWESRLIKSSFWYNGKVLDCGYPRSDILLKNSESAYKKIRQLYGLNENDKILLYAPTFRQSRDEKSLGAYRLDWENTLKALNSLFGGKWIGMMRLHPNVSALTSRLSIPEEVIDVTSYDDMQELITACDCMISDYSSSIMDAGVANKVGFILALDYSDYEKDRDVYFNIKDDLPFPFSETNKALISNILNFDKDKYKCELSHFLKDIYGVYDKGDASAEICKIIDDITHEDSY